MPEISATHNQPEYSVSEISQALKRTVEDSFGYVRVRGELSGFKRAASGHLYMDLKDDKAVLKAVCWRGNAAKLSFKPEDGLEVIASGKLSTYPGRSNYQLVVESMEPAGLGALMALLEKRKKELAAEGLFDPERKQPLPFMPRRIGVITSPTGAVIRDILHRIADRFPVHVLVWPVLVQGEGAAEQVTEAVQGFNVVDDGLQPDLLIVARGGGSLEDLWAFNEEIVVRAVAESVIPVISAVGHETDTTLIDYVSDQRAPTPTAAAEMAVPVREEWQVSVRDSAVRLDNALTRYLSQQKETVLSLARALPSPQQFIQFASQRLDDWTERLSQSPPLYLQQRERQLQLIMAQLKPAAIMQQINVCERDIEHKAKRLNLIMTHQLQDQTQRIDALSQLLQHLDYQQILKRGFALVRTADGALVSNASEAGQQAMLQLQFHDGELDVAPVTKPKASTSATKKMASKKADDSQSSLF